MEVKNEKDKFYLGLGRSQMKNNDADWALHCSLNSQKKYKNGNGIELNLNNNDSLSLLIKEIIKESILLLEDREYKKLKVFLMKNFDLKIGDLK